MFYYKKHTYNLGKYGSGKDLEYTLTVPHLNIVHQVLKVKDLDEAIKEAEKTIETSNKVVDTKNKKYN